MHFQSPTSYPIWEKDCSKAPTTWLEDDNSSIEEVLVVEKKSEVTEDKINSNGSP